MIQFVCVRDGRESFRSLTAERIQIHPGSCMYREEPQFIVAGEIVRTSRMYAMSVSPLSKTLLSRIDENLLSRLIGPGKGKQSDYAERSSGEKNGRKREQPIKGGNKPSSPIASGLSSEKNRGVERPDGITFGGEFFEIARVKGKKQLTLPHDKFTKILSSVDFSGSYTAQIAGLRGKIMYGSHELLSGEKMEVILKVATTFNLEQVDAKSWPRKQNFISKENPDELIHNLHWLFRVTIAKEKSKELGFICLFTDGNGQYWFKCSRGFHTALNESIASLEALIDETSDTLEEGLKNEVNTIYRKLNSFFN